MITKTITLAGGDSYKLAQLTVREVRAIEERMLAAANDNERVDASFSGVAVSINKAAGPDSAVTVDNLLDKMSYGDLRDLNEALAALNQMTLADVKPGESKAE